MVCGGHVLQVAALQTEAILDVLTDEVRVLVWIGVVADETYGSAHNSNAQTHCHAHLRLSSSHTQCLLLMRVHPLGTLPVWSKRAVGDQHAGRGRHHMVDWQRNSPHTAAACLLSSTYALLCCLCCMSTTGPETCSG